MSGLSYYPGAALPPSVNYVYDVQSTAFPYQTHTSYNKSYNDQAGANCPTGPASLRQFPGRCSQLKGAFGAHVYPDFHMQQQYEHPHGVRFQDLPYGTGANDCTPTRGCLDPKAINYDKVAGVHWQALCKYRQPKVCVEQPAAAYVSDNEYGVPLESCAKDAKTGRTALQKLYDSSRGGKERSSAVNFDA